MKIELLYWDGCPSHPEAKALLEAALAEVSLDAHIALREIATPEEAEAESFPGSPTIRIDGRDVDPPAGGARPSLSCRIYGRPDGRSSPVPTKDQIKEALVR